MGWRCLQAAVGPGVQCHRPQPLTGSSLAVGQPQALRSLRLCESTHHAVSRASQPAAARRLAIGAARLAALPERLQQLAEEWLEQDGQPSSRREIEQLVAAEDAAGLEERLGKRLQVGASVKRNNWARNGLHSSNFVKFVAWPA